MVTRLLFDNNKVIGVEYMQGGKLKQVYSSEDVVLSGGAINSPQLLMLSGIGRCKRVNISYIIIIWFLALLKLLLDIYEVQ